MEEFKPGQVIVPQPADPDDISSTTQPASSTSGASTSAATPVTPEQTSVPDSAPAQQPPNQPAAMPAPATPAAADTGWQFRAEAEDSPSAASYAEITDVTWTASEFIAHEKSKGWYWTFGGVSLLVAVVIFLLTRDKITTTIIVLAALSFGTFAARKPRLQTYQLEQGSLLVGQKQYLLHDFKSFSLSEEGAIISVIFMPLKRFMPSLTVYVAPEAENAVVDHLAAYLPLEQHKPDAVDSLLNRIRF